MREVDSEQRLIIGHSLVRIQTVHRRNPLAKKTALKKKATTKKTADYSQSLREIQKLSKTLELNLQKLQKKIAAFPHNPFKDKPDSPSSKK
jgi:phage shock protein A